MVMMTRYAAGSLVIAVLGLWTAPASAQTVSDVLDFLVTGHSVQTGSVERDTAAAAATSLTVSRALLANLATLPVPTSSGGFVYKFHPELGTVQRATSSFGPFFVERALAPGHGAASIGLTLQHWQFTALDGRNLRDGTLETTANQFVDELEPFDVDRLRLAIDASIATVHGSVGVGSRTEISAALPFIVLRLNGSRVNAYRGQVFTQAEASATATGLADVVVRTKYTLFEDGAAGVAAAVEARLPTGRQEDLLGSGAMSWKLSAIGSLEGARLSSHANVGFGFGGLAARCDDRRRAGGVGVGSPHAHRRGGRPLDECAWRHHHGRGGAPEPPRRSHAATGAGRIDTGRDLGCPGRQMERQRHVGAGREYGDTALARRADREAHAVHRLRLHERRMR